MKELEQELDKVFTFQHVKSDDIIRRIKASEKEVEEVIGKHNAAQASQRDGGAQVQGPSEEDFELLEEDLSDIIADVHDLAKFTQLNYTGFQKIIKKHDVRRSRLHRGKNGNTDGRAENDRVAFKTSLRDTAECEAFLEG